MPLSNRLKIGSVVFAVLWIAFMILWSGEFGLANIIILTVCGCIGGYLWYLGMRWFFRYRGALPPGGDVAGPANER